MPLQSTTRLLPQMTDLRHWQKPMVRIGYRLSEVKVIGSFFLATMIIILGVRIMFDVSTVTFVHPQNPELMKRFGQFSDGFLNAPIIRSWVAWRSPVLLGIGVILPLIVFVFNWSNRAITTVLTPYFLLVGAQFATLTFAKAMIGQGGMSFTGLVYSLFRFLQLIGLIDQTKESMTLAKRKSDDVYPWFKKILRIELFLWLFNAAFLFVYICLVFIGLGRVGLDVRVEQ
jgi:hypothetical protein